MVGGDGEAGAATGRRATAPVGAAAVTGVLERAACGGPPLSRVASAARPVPTTNTPAPTATRMVERFLGVGLDMVGVPLGVGEWLLGEAGMAAAGRGIGEMPMAATSADDNVEAELWPTAAGWPG